MPLEIHDRLSAWAVIERRHPGVGMALPPLAETGLCARCGEPAGPNATRSLHVVPPTTDIAVAVLLCPAHASEER